MFQLKNTGKTILENNIKSWDQITKTVTVSNLSNAQSSKEYFSISPNPTSNSVLVHWKNYDNNIKYQLSDVSGKVIASSNLTNNTNEISLVGFSSGMYFLKITTDKINQTIKIIKK